MPSPLPITGTAQLLAVLSPYVPDEFINQLLPGKRVQGRRHYFSAAQLWRVHLLALLTATHSFNGVVRLLPEQLAWRRFAQLDHRYRTPDVRMLCEFRALAGVAALRRINEELMRRLLRFLPATSLTVALIDATDLPAATADNKKKPRTVGPPNGPRWARVRSRPATPGFMSVIKSIRSGCGCAIIRRRFCWCRWSVGPRQPMFQRVIYSRPASGNASNG